MFRVLVVAICLGSAAILPAPARAQSQATTGQVTGAIADNSGGVLPGVSVTIASSATGFTRTVATAEDGLYTLVQIPPGTYELKAELCGFQTATVAATASANRIVVREGNWARVYMAVMLLRLRLRRGCSIDKLN